MSGVETGRKICPICGTHKICKNSWITDKDRCPVCRTSLSSIKVIEKTWGCLSQLKYATQGGWLTVENN